MMSCEHKGTLRMAGEDLWCEECGALRVYPGGRWTKPKVARKLKRRAFKKPLTKKGGKSRDAGSVKEAG